MRATWLETGEELTIAHLRGADVLYAKLPPAHYQSGLDDLKRTRGYVQQDEVHMTPAMPNFDAISAKFSREHFHDDDEVRFVLDGEGIFDIRTKDGRMMRVVVEAGDLIVVPAGRNHLFTLTDLKTIRAVRLFKDPQGWVPHYRPSDV